jgi:hypothetical protein
MVVSSVAERLHVSLLLQNTYVSTSIDGLKKTEPETA